VLTLAALVRQRPFHLRVLAGADDLDQPVDWVHVSELADPAPFLRPGTLLLTTGLQLTDVESYVPNLVAAGAVGLGFGVGLSHGTVPSSLVDACSSAGLPLLEVPFETRFADVVRFVAADEARTAVRAVKSTVEIERLLVRALSVADPVGEVAARLARWLGGWAMVLDRDLEVVAAAPAKARKELAAVRTELGRIDPAGRFSVSWSSAGLAVSAHPIDGGYLAVGAPELPLDGPAVIAIAVMLLSFQAEHADRLRAAAARLLLNGFVGDAARIVPLPKPPVRVAVVRDVDVEGLLSVDDVCILPDLRQLVLGEKGRAAVSDPVSLSDIPRAVEQARSLVGALTGPGMVTAADGLLSLVDTPAVREYVRVLLAPVRDPVLLDTLRTFLACDGSWVDASARLQVHRHTLRYRIQKVEELLGRRLDDTGTRAELWLALHLDK
jgi:purine catabolism regulator